MNFEHLFAGDGVVRAGLAGVGQFGVSLISQCERVRRLEIAVACDVDPHRARDAFVRAGVPETSISVCDTLDSAKGALERGQRVVLADASLIASLPVDVVVEATGVPEVAASIGEAAIDAGKHVAMVTKEAESVIGPLLAARAADAGCVYTAVDGDQPSLLMGLVSWARTLGLDIAAAGKSSEYDFVHHADEGAVHWTGRAFEAPGLDREWQLPEGDVAGCLARRATILAAIAQRTVPDLCEMGVVANSTGLAPDTPAFHAPIARTVEVPTILRPREAGGILAGGAIIDVFNCLRRPDEASFAGGVFVVVACHDRETWRVLADKGHPVSPDGGFAMLYNPQHLLGLEAPISILACALLGHGATTGVPHHRFDLVARASRAWKAGETLAITDAHHHEVAGLTPELIAAGPVCDEQPLPYYMAAGQVLRRDVAAGEPIRAGDVTAPAQSVLWRLRAELDDRFHARQR